MSASSAFGTSVTIPDAARTERAVEKIEPSQSPESSLPSPLSGAETSIPPVITRPPNAGAIAITLTGIDLDGASVFSTAELSRLWTPHLGARRTLATLYDIADAITKTYRDAGYSLARAYIPEQDIAGGRARIAVFEGRIGSVTVTGDLSGSALIADVSEQIRSQNIFNIHQLESALLRLNDLPGSDFRLVLTPGTNSTINLNLVASTTSQVSGAVTVTNSGSRYLGPVIASVPLRFEGVWGDFDVLDLRLDTTLPTRELRNAAVSYQVPVFSPDLTARVSGNVTRGTPGHTLSNNDIRSSLKSLDVQLDYTAIRQRDETLILSTGLMVQQARTELAGSRLARDHVRAAYCTADYSWQNRGLAQSRLRTTIMRGFPDLFGGSGTGDDDLSRADAQADFLTGELEFSHLHPLGGGWQVLGAITGQVASGPLYSTVEFGYGGSFYGRGYDPSQYAGDSGVAGTIELRTPARDIGLSMVAIPYVFLDYGRVWNRDDGQAARESGASAGFGSRILGPYGVQADIAVARPLLNADDPTTNKVQGNRFLFSLSRPF